MSRLILTRRHLLRLWRSRFVLIGAGLGLLSLGLFAIGTYMVMRGSAVADISFEIQRRFWSEGLFDFVVLVIAIVLGANVVNEDLKLGTAFGVLARPISRTDYFLGSWLGAAIVIVALETMRNAAAAGTALWFDGRVSSTYLLGLTAVVLGALLHLSLFAAIGAISSTTTAVLLGILVFVIEGVAFQPKVPTWLTYPLRVPGSILPLLYSHQTLIERTLLGAERGFRPILEAIAYEACWTIALVAVGCRLFSSREVAPRV